MPHTDPKEGITAIQGLRNGSLGATILGTAAAQLASRVIAVLTTPAQLAQVEAFSTSDPIMNGKPGADRMREWEGMEPLPCTDQAGPSRHDCSIPARPANSTGRGKSYACTTPLP